MLAWLMNPLMLGLGALAVASPIIIHLLNRRRFKIVEWAAMDFLFEANKKNRRRVQIENFLLLFLRCLAMLLIGLLLARPFLPTDVVKVVQPDQKFERIFLVDDSLSSQVLNGDMPSIDVAKDSLARLVTEFADSNETEDWLTVALTSNAEQPILANEPVTKETLPALLETIGKIEATDTQADYTASLSEVRRYFSGDEQNVSRVAYFFSDMRVRDWAASADTQPDTAPNQLFNQIALDSADCYLIDTGGPNDGNLAITSFRALDLQVANRVIRFAAAVTNFGSSSINGVRVVFKVDDAPPQYQVVSNLLPGETKEVVFPYLFTSETDSLGNGSSEASDEPPFRNYKIVAEIDRQSMTADELNADQLLADSSAYSAARIFDGIPVLLVDGDPSAVAERSETHYLNSLNVLGTGLRSETVTVTELETVSLSKYRVIFLCNVDEASPDRIRSLKSWVEDGGNLVLMPGDKIRAATFNESFYQAGEGLSPISLNSIAGDPTMASWVNFEVDPQTHPALRIVVDSDQTSLSRVDVFSWWTSEFDEAEVGKSLLVPLRLNDDRNSPAMVERSWGGGRVIVFAIPGDGDWSMWPSSPTYAPVMIDMIDYLVGAVGEVANVKVGGKVTYPVDLSASESRVYLRDPDGERMEAVARPIVDEGGQDQDDVLCRVQFDNVTKRGFYEVGLKRHTGESDTVLFASNVDPLEGELNRMEESQLEGDFFVDKIRRVVAADIKNEEVSGGNTEIWPQVIWLLLAVLATEQFLGWWFGRKR